MSCLCTRREYPVPGTQVAHRSYQELSSCICTYVLRYAVGFAVDVASITGRTEYTYASVRSMIPERLLTAQNAARRQRQRQTEREKAHALYQTSKLKTSVRR